MTTATRRLRRTGVASLAASVTAGVVLIATATSAFAAEKAVGTQIGTVTATTLYPGTTAQAVGDLQMALPNAFAIGDTITVQLAGVGASCGTTNGAVGYTSAPAVAASGPFTAAFGSTAGDTADRTPTFTSVLQSSAGACTTAGIKDQLLITLTNSSLGTAGNSYTVSVTGTKVTVGSAVTPGAITEKPASGAAVTVATVANTKASITEVSAAPSSLGVALNPLTLTEVTAGAFLPASAATTVTLTLTGAGTPKFHAAVTPVITVPTGYTVTPAATTASATYTFTVTAPATAVAATVTVKGLTVDLTAAGTGVVKINASTGAVANIGGAAQTAIGVLNQSRIGGIDRYATSAQLFTSGGATTTAVVAGGLGFADGLSANYLAGQLGTGTLLTDPLSLPQSTKQALYTTGVATVYILGGTAAVSANVATQIAALHVGNVPTAALINVIRIAGADRYATNNAVDLYLGAGSATGATAYVASGNGFADALTIGPASYDQGNPLVLVDGTATTLTPAAQSTIVNLGITKVIIVGGTAVVTAAIETAIHTATGATVLNRLAGADRTLTAAAIAKYETTSGAGGIAASGTYVDVAGLAFDPTRAYITNGLGYADALSAGPVAGSNTNPILLTGGTVLGAGIPTYFSGKAGIVNNVVALGLTGVLPVSIVNAAIATLS